MLNPPLGAGTGARSGWGEAYAEYGVGGATRLRDSPFYLYGALTGLGAMTAGRDIFRDREIHRDGAIVVVRPDQYVSGIFPLSARDELKTFFAQHMLPVK